ncbi:PKD domain-containing protein, partial [Kamptonema cortianum]|nr:PKD domain-containing protein [Kamptonema cortianum]
NADPAADGRLQHAAGRWQSAALVFLNQSSPDVFAVEWNFGDGSPTSSEFNPFHQYPIGNVYLVTLTVTGPGGQNSIQQQVQVFDPTPVPATETPIPPPTADFSTEPVEGNPLALRFINESSPDVFAFEWMFGDNMGFSSEPSPTYQYAAGGTYIVTLTVTGPGGSNFVQQEVTVTDPIQTLPIEVPPIEPLSSPTIPQVEPSFTLQGFAGPVTGVSWNPSGFPPQVATSSDDDSGLVWDVFNQQVVMPLSGFSANVNAVAWNPTAPIVALGGDEGVIRLFDPASGAIIATLSGHTGAVNALAWLNNGSLLVSAGSDQTVIVWDANGNLLANLQAHTDDVLAAVFTPDGSRVITGAADGRILAWDWASGTIVWQVIPHTGAVNDIAITADGTRIATAGDDGMVLLWNNVGDTTPAGSLQLDDTEITAIAFHPDGSRLITGNNFGEIYIWNIASGQPIQALSGHMDRITDIAYNADGSQVAASSDDTSVLIWQP